MIGLRDIYLTADTEPHIETYPDSGPMNTYFLADSTALSALKSGRAVVYAVNGRSLRNITPLYTQLLANRADELELSPRVEPGEPLYQSQVVEGFHDLEDRFRWMSKRGVVRLRGPRIAAEQLEISGSCPAQQMEKGPLRLTVSVDGNVIATHAIDRANLDFTFRDRLPASTVGKKAIEVAIEVDRTISTPADDRKLGVIISAVSVEP
jgi:hypothetical protein